MNKTIEICDQVKSEIPIKSNNLVNQFVYTGTTILISSRFHFWKSQGLNRNLVSGMELEPVIRDGAGTD